MFSSKEVVNQFVIQIVKWIAIAVMVTSIVGGIAGFFISRFFR